MPVHLGDWSPPVARVAPRAVAREKPAQIPDEIGSDILRKTQSRDHRDRERHLLRAVSISTYLQPTLEYSHR